MAEEKKAVDSAAGEANVTTKPNKKKMPTWLKVTLIVVAVLVGLFVIIMVTATSATKEAANKANTFANYLVSNDVSNAYAMTSKGFKTATTQDQLKQYFDQLNQVFGGGTVKLQEKLVESSTDKGNNGVATFTIVKNGKTYYAKVQLIKEDGQWKVINFATSENKLEAKIE